MNNRITAAYVSFVLASMGISGPAALVRADDSSMQGSEKKDRRGGLPNVGMSGDQARTFKHIYSMERAALTPLREQEREDLMKLAGQVKAQASDAEIQLTLDQLRSLHQSIETQTQRFHAEYDALLTPIQRAKVLLDRTHRNV